MNEENNTVSIRELKPQCQTCGEDCDFGQRGDGPAEQDPKTGLTFCDAECFGIHLVQERRRENGILS